MKRFFTVYVDEYAFHVKPNKQCTDENGCFRSFSLIRFDFMNFSLRNARNRNGYP